MLPIRISLLVVLKLTSVLLKYSICIESLLVNTQILGPRGTMCGVFLDSEEQLCRLFWADRIARDSYASFGDVISFDATYDTNK